VCKFFKKIQCFFFINIRNLICKYLSNELLFDIFEYSYGEKLFDAFYDLNHRIGSILNDCRLLIHITFS
jgi:hypothetical protein